MQSGREIPVRLLMFFYPISILDVGGEVTICVVCIARENVVIVIIWHRCNIQSVLRLSLIVIPLSCSEFLLSLRRRGPFAPLVVIVALV